MTAAPANAALPLAVPITVELPEPLAAEVAAWVEAEAGWHVVAAHGPVRPRLRLVEAEALATATAPAAAATPGGSGSGAASSPGAAQAVVVALVAGDIAEGVRRAALAAGALDVVAWPQERERLRAAPAHVPAAPVLPEVPVVRVGATAGGVGASTVALALGGLVAWSGRRAVVIGGDDLLRLCGRRWVGPGAAELAALEPLAAAEELPSLLRQAPGVVRLSLLGGGAAALATTAGWPVDVVVSDLGTSPPVGCEVVVARADASADRAGELRAGRVLVTGGPLSPAAVADRLGRADVHPLESCNRVARAALRGRVPADLPGSWLAALGRACGMDVRAAGPPRGGRRGAHRRGGAR